MNRFAHTFVYEKFPGITHHTYSRFVKNVEIYCDIMVYELICIIYRLRWRTVSVIRSIINRVSMPRAIRQ